MPILDLSGSSSGVADGTVNALVLDTQRHLNGVRRAEITKLTTTVTSDAGSLVLTYSPAGVRTGALLAVDDELVYVWAYNTGTLTATVERGYAGSTAAAHTAGALIEVEPTYPRAHIIRALRDEILSWGSSLYQIATTTLAASATTRTISLPAANVIKVLDVWRAAPSGTTAPRRVAYRFLRDQDTTLYPGGTAISLDAAVDSGTDLFVTYAAPYTITTFDSTTSLDAIGLSDNVLDIPPLGAAYRLVTTGEVHRNDTQAHGQSRNAEDVPAFAIARVGTVLKQLRDQRLQEETNRLSQKYAWRWS